jgi:hypothetical protein
MAADKEVTHARLSRMSSCARVTFYEDDMVSLFYDILTFPFNIYVLMWQLYKCTV